jgi:hypothetical protein
MLPFGTADNSRKPPPPQKKNSWESPSDLPARSFPNCLAAQQGPSSSCAHATRKDVIEALRQFLRRLEAHSCGQERQIEFRRRSHRSDVIQAVWPSSPSLNSICSHSGRKYPSARGSQSDSRTFSYALQKESSCAGPERSPVVLCYLLSIMNRDPDRSKKQKLSTHHVGTFIV